MSNKHKNYNQYYNNKGNQYQPKVENKPAAEETVTVTTAVAEETITVTAPAVEETVTTGYVETVTEAVDTDISSELDVGEPDTANDWVFGIVEGCVKLNVRMAPDTEAPVVTVIDAGTTLKTFPAMGTKDFYCVRTESGVNGYCMKKFIRLYSK